MQTVTVGTFTDRRNEEGFNIHPWENSKCIKDKVKWKSKQEPEKLSGHQRKLISARSDPGTQPQCYTLARLLCTNVQWIWNYLRTVEVLFVDWNESLF